MIDAKQLKEMSDADVEFFLLGMEEVDRKRVAQQKELEGYIEKLWSNCHITFHPSKNGYPIEHNPVAKKDGRGFIEAELNEL